MQGNIFSSPSATTSVSTLLGETGVQALANAARTALLWVDGERTYGQLRERALKLAAALRKRGLKDGDRLATMLFNRGETFELYFACAFAGLTIVPISFRLTASEVSMIVEDCAPGLIFTEAELRPVVDEAVKHLPLANSVITLDAHASGAAYEEFVNSAEPLADHHFTPIQLILYTSGTTGRPKGVAMTHTNILWCAFQQAALFRNLSADSVMLLTGPMYNTAAMNESSIPTFLVGGTNAILPSLGWTPERMARLINEWRVTHGLIFPSMFRPFLDLDEKTPMPFSNLRWVLTGGENCPPAVMSAFRKRWPHIWLVVAYGSTETGFVTIVEDEDIEGHPGSVGRATPGQSVRVVSADGTVAAVNEIGEVWTSGPAVISNYWNAPDLDAATVKNGWLKIGDLGRMDENGHLFIAGRTKDLIISKSQNIYPAEIENVLRNHPDIADAAVVGVPDEEFGEAVCAVVVLRNGRKLQPEEVIAFSRQSLASYKKPRHVVFVSEFPRGSSGKVKKDELASTCRAYLSGQKV